MDLIPVDEKKFKVIKDYPMLSVCIFEAMVIVALVVFIIIPDRKEYNDHLKLDLQKEEKRGEKKDEMLDLWREMGKQFTDLKTITYRTDTMPRK